MSDADIAYEQVPLQAEETFTSKSCMPVLLGRMRARKRLSTVILLQGDRHAESRPVTSLEHSGFRAVEAHVQEAAATDATTDGEPDWPSRAISRSAQLAVLWQLRPTMLTTIPTAAIPAAASFASPVAASTTRGFISVQAHVHKRAWMPDDPDMLRVCKGFAASGGVASGNQIASLLRCRSQQPISVLARWIVSRQVLCFRSRSQMLLPMFQFDLAAGEIRFGVRQVIAELSSVFDDEELAAWFVTPNAWLENRTPVSVTAVEPAAVQQAARADRYVARG